MENNLTPWEDMPFPQLHLSCVCVLGGSHHADDNLYWAERGKARSRLCPCGDELSQGLVQMELAHGIQL